MKQLSPTQNFSLTSLYCSTFGHSFSISNKITNYINEYKCKTCGQEVTNGASGDIEILTFKNKKVNACVSAFFQKKLQHTSAI
jgi:translation initiation factor 2 beta subunit (eIF-2beta)/eIF-5